MSESYIYSVTVNQITKKDRIKENGACPIMIIGLSGLNLEKKYQAGQKKQILARRFSTQEESYLISSPHRRVYGGPTT